MNELRSILDAADGCDEPLFLATVVDVVGSSYRRPGTRMLILPGGKHVGTISGGCLERDLCRQAAELCRDGARLISFDTRDESTNLNARFNLGCQGILYVLVEPVTKDKHCPLLSVRHAMKTRSPVVVGTVYEANGLGNWTPGRRLLGEDIRGLPPLERVFDRVRRDGTPICCQIEAKEDTNGRLLVERLHPPKPLWVFGAGDDAIPLARIATEIGWSVSVIDDRASELAPDRFPTAERRIHTAIDEAHSRLKPSRETAAIVMTHSFAKDAVLLPWLCRSDVSYIGLLGPKSRTGKLMQSLHRQRQLPPLEQLERFHTPVGMDIGATTPAEIAIAIVAEVIATDKKRAGNPLSDRQGPIHEPVMHELIRFSVENALQTERQCRNVGVCSDTDTFARAHDDIE
ncbi:MAG: XdhC family protein [Planctomycetota bacterium]